MSSSAEYKPIKATQVRIAAERFYVLLEDGRELGIPYDWYWRLAGARLEELNNWRLIAGGQGISWEDLDEDLSVLGLLEGRSSGKTKKGCFYQQESLFCKSKQSSLETLHRISLNA
ncbi:MAG: DUF2442 domain-containing protein [Haliscomenobacter sp.]|uniref:DUF2442 domain-containing protein n=1 Tax=Haliscomenobacter sp. TaxID=2717303 RepID=UPI0029AE5209|nr:DUF2442 domain-containing protein [Haliscomenobacter sp.]MDX2068843.1 DUF2442 domain-containing protein [Haliscomenobacter sp.]